MMIKLKQVKETVHLFKGELQLMAQNTTFFSQMMFAGFDKVCYLFNILNS